MYFTIGYEDFAEKAIFSLKNLEKESGFNINLTVNESRPYLCFYTDH